MPCGSFILDFSWAWLKNSFFKPLLVVITSISDKTGDLKITNYSFASTASPWKMQKVLHENGPEKKQSSDKNCIILSGYVSEN